MRPMFRESNSGFPSGLNTFKQPCHISCQDTHCLQTFLIIPNFFRSIPVNDIPILRRHYRHITISHIFVQLVKSRCTSATAASCNGCRRFAGKMFSIEFINKEYTIHKRCHRTAGSCIMNGSSKDKPIILVDQSSEIIDRIFSETTLSIRDLAYAAVFPRKCYVTANLWESLLPWRA